MGVLSGALGKMGHGLGGGLSRERGGSMLDNLGKSEKRGGHGARVRRGHRKSRRR